MNTDGTFFDAIAPELAERLLPRRRALRDAGTMGAGILLASVPTTLALLCNSAFGRESAPQEINDALNFALKLEYLELELYTRALAATGLIADAGDRAVFTQIQKHETAHVEYLSGALGAHAVAKPNFDFTAKGALPDPFAAGNYEGFLALAQAFEDIGVRAYKGQMRALASSPDILSAALRIHSVEGRHAAEVRRIRGFKGWITGSTLDVGLPVQVTEAYAGENVTTQIGVPIGQGPDAASEAFDEPLTIDQVLTVVGRFIA